VAHLLCDTITEAAPNIRWDIVLDEIEAFEKALSDMDESEVVILFYDNLQPALEENKAEPVGSFRESAELLSMETSTLLSC
jgi:hypothetical protein